MNDEPLKEQAVKPGTSEQVLEALYAVYAVHVNGSLLNQK